MMLVEDTNLPESALPIPAFRAHLRLGSGFADDTLQDPVLEGFLRAAIAAIEARTGKILLDRAFALRLQDWRDPLGERLPVAPVTEITDFVLSDAEGVEVIVDPSTYRLVVKSGRPIIVPDASLLPVIPAGGQAEIRFTAGFATTFEDLPPDLAQAVMMLGAHYYEHRGAAETSQAGFPFGVSVLIERFKSVRLVMRLTR